MAQVKHIGHVLIALFASLAAAAQAATYEYDPNGNRLALDGFIYQYGLDSNRLESAGGVSLTYDGAGNRIADQDGARTFHYDSLGRLIEVQLNGQTLATYAYDHRHLRIAKTTAAGTVRYHYDEAGHLIGESDAGGATVREYVWLDDLPIAQIDIAGTTEQVTFLHLDHLGSPRYGTDEQGTVVWRWVSDAFGVGLPDEDPDDDGQSVTVNLRFPGQYYDAETGLNYNYFRYYDPTTGRYITSDPIGLAGGLNTYAYVGGNPLMLIDPFGLAGCYVGYPGYPITIPGTSTKAPITHAGVLSYDTQGHTRYYEYGRYDSNFGEVKRRTVPDLQMGPDGNPTPESWAKLIEALNKIGHGTEAETSCDAKADADKINDFSDQRMNDPNRAPYSWNPFNFNTCITFANDAMGAGLK